MKNLFVIVLFLGLLNGISAQWVQTSGPEGGDIVAMTIKGSSVFVSARGSGVFRSDDFGSSWTAKSDGIDLGPTQIMEFLVYGNSIYAAGHSSFLRSDDNGDHWVRVPMPGGGAGSPVCLSNTDMYITSAYQQGVFRAAMNDTNWVSIGLADQDIHCLAYGNSALWAGTTNGIFRLDGGIWTHVFDIGQEIHCMAFYENIIFAGGSDVWSSENHGDTWVSVGGGIASPNCFAIKGSYIYAGCWNGICKSPLGGNINWSWCMNGLAYYRVQSMTVLNTIVFAGAYGGVFLSGDGGNTWSLKNHGLIATACFVKADNERIIAGANPDGFFYTTDKGANWTPISAGLWRYDHVMLGLSDIASDSSTYYAATENGIYRSPDHGATWNQENTNLATGYTSAVQCAGPWVFAGTTGNGVWRSEKGDLFWNDFNNNLPGDATIESLLLVADTDLYACTWNYGIWRRGISGAYPWVELNNGLGPSPAMAIAGNSHVLFAGTLHEGIYRSYDRGEHWQVLREGVIRGTGGIAMRNDTVIIMTEDGLMFSKNLGNTFTSICTEDLFGGESILIGDKDVFDCSSTGGIWKRPLSDLHAFAVERDSVILKKFINDTNSFVLECDTTWYILGTMQDWLTADHMNGNGDDRVLFTTTQENTGDNDRSGLFTLISSRGDSIEFEVIQKGRNSGISEKPEPGIKVYPNPSKGSVWVNSAYPVSSINIMTADGRTVEEFSCPGERSILKLDLPGKGLWLIRFTTLRETILKKVLVIRE